MTEDEYTELIKDANQEPRVYVSDFDGHDRTLLYGYTCDRTSFHVYLWEGQIWRVEYHATSLQLLFHAVADSFRAVDLIPDRRVYPEATDFQMAQRLQALGVRVPYKPFDVERWEYYQKALPFVGKRVG
jgi:hypothetical protein